MSTLRFNLLGIPRIELDGASVRMGRRKTAALLYYIAATGKPLARGPATGLLWPEFAPDRARTSLRRALVDANDSTGLRVLDPDLDILRFSDDIAVEVDAAEFPALVNEGLASRDGQAVQRLEQAVALYRSEFLSGFYLKDAIEFEDWQLGLADRFKARAVEALERLAHGYRAEGRTAEAESLADRIIQCAPLDEAGHRMAVEMLADRGEASAARAHYEAYAAALGRELGSRPEPSFARLYDDLKAGKRVPAPPPPMIRHGALPRPLSSFVGREDDLALLGCLLRERRLVTLVGLGGIGKTRLAIEAATAAERDNRFADGAMFVDLAPACPGEALARIASALDAPLRPGEDAPNFAARMASLGALVVLDNCERVIEECAALAAALLSSARDVVILATSLEPLGIEGETTLLVRPLTIAAVDAPESEQLTSDAARLFLDRAASADPRGNHAAKPALVSGICRALEGIPLAIELVVARVRAFTLREIAASLDDIFKAAADGPPGFEPRHRSLESLLAWSWARLSQEESSDLEALSVCQGGFDAEAASGVLGRPSIGPIAKLVDKSLLTAYTTEDGQERWRLLDPVRLFAHRRLEATGREAACRNAHASHFSARAARLGRTMMIIRDAMALDEADREWPNLAAAFSWLSSSGRPGSALEAMIALRRFFLIRDRTTELTSILARIDVSMLSKPEHAAWNELSAVCAWFSLDMSKLEEHSLAAARCWEAAGDELSSRRSELIWLGFSPRFACGLCPVFTGGIDGIRIRLGDSVAVFGKLGERGLECEALISLARQELTQTYGSRAIFRETSARASALAEATGDLEALIACAWLDGESSRPDADADAAEAERALERCRRYVAAIGSTRYLVDMLSQATYRALQRGEFDMAEAYASETAGTLERMGHFRPALDMRIVQAEALNLAGRPEAATAAMARARALAGDEDAIVAFVDHHAALQIASRGETGAAVLAMQKAIDMAEPGSPSSIKLRFWTARMLLALGKHDAAGKLFSEVRPAFSETREPAFHEAIKRFMAFVEAGSNPEGAATMLRRVMAQGMDSANAITAEWWAATASRAFAQAGAAEQAFRAALFTTRGIGPRRMPFRWEEWTLFTSLVHSAAEAIDPETRHRLEAEAGSADPDGNMETYVRSIAERLTMMICEVFGGAGASQTGMDEQRDTDRQGAPGVPQAPRSSTKSPPR